MAGLKRKVERPKSRCKKPWKGVSQAPGTGVVGLLNRVERREGAKEREVGRVAILIPRQSSGGLVHAPCPMRDPPFPDAALPSGSLLQNG